MKHNRKMLLNMMSLLLLAALCLSVSQKGAAAETLTCVVKNGQYVNVRNQASQTAATWGILHTGDTIDANPSEIVNGYFKTTYKDRVAYVSVKYFEIAVGESYYVDANGRVRLRKSPGGSAAGFIQPGERVHVMAWRYANDGSKWAKCAGGQYIAAEYPSLAD